MGRGQSQVLPQLAQGGEGVRGVVRGLGEDGGHGGREPGDGHRGHRREVQVLGFVGRRNVELGRLEVELVGVLGPGRGVGVRRVNRRDVFRGVAGQLEGGRGVGVRVPGRCVLGLVAPGLLASHVQHPDDGVGPGRHQALLPVRVVGHVADAEPGLQSRHVEVELVPLVDDVVVVRRLVVVPGAVVVLANVVGVVILRAVGPSQPLPVDVLHDVLVSLGLVRLVVLCAIIMNVYITSDIRHQTHTCVLQQNLVHVCAGVLEQLVVGVEDDHGDLTVAQHAQLVGFLHQAKLPLGESHLSVPLVGDPLD